MYQSFFHQKRDIYPAAITFLLSLSETTSLPYKGRGKVTHTSYPPQLLLAPNFKLKQNLDHYGKDVVENHICVVLFKMDIQNQTSKFQNSANYCHMFNLNSLYHSLKGGYFGGGSVHRPHTPKGLFLIDLRLMKTTFNHKAKKIIQSITYSSISSQLRLSKQSSVSIQLYSNPFHSNSKSFTFLNSQNKNSK